MARFEIPLGDDNVTEKQIVELVQNARCDTEFPSDPQVVCETKAAKKEIGVQSGITKKDEYVTSAELLIPLGDLGIEEIIRRARECISFGQYLEYRGTTQWIPSGVYPHMNKGVA